MKVELEKITLGYSALTKSIFAGITNKAQTLWIHKTNVTNAFLTCVILRFKGDAKTKTSSVFDSDGNEYVLRITQVSKKDKKDKIK